MIKNRTSILIPSRNEVFLHKTVNEVMTKSTGDVEVIVLLDGYWPYPDLPEYKNMILVHRGTAQGMRRGINSAAAVASGEYLMKLDAHCLLAKGFDEVLKADCDDDWVVIPRRYRLDPDKWDIREVTPGSPPIDYEYFIYPKKYDPPSLHGFRWDEKQKNSEHIEIDDRLTFQGSSWFMKRKHFDRHNFMQVEGYEGLPQQEAEEIGLTTWTNGGRVIVNKRTWYAHLHKGDEYGRGYFLDVKEMRRCYAYSYNHWVIERREQFTKVIERFMPLPEWPKNWAKDLYR